MIYREIFGNFYTERIAFKEDGKSILLCNYRVELTPSEYTLLSLLCKEKTWICKDLIATEIKSSVSSIPVHVANINKKARSVSSRALIEGNRQGKYRVVENI